MQALIHRHDAKYFRDGASIMRQKKDTCLVKFTSLGGKQKPFWYKFE